MGKKMFVVTKITHHDFICEHFVLGVTDDEKKAQALQQKEVEKEIAFQKANGLSFDTVEDDKEHFSYSAYDEGYECAESVSIFVGSGPCIDTIS